MPPIERDLGLCVQTLNREGWFLFSVEVEAAKLRTDSFKLSYSDFLNRQWQSRSPARPRRRSVAALPAARQRSERTQATPEAGRNCSLSFSPSRRAWPWPARARPTRSVQGYWYWARAAHQLACGLHGGDLP